MGSPSWRSQGRARLLANRAHAWGPNSWSPGRAQGAAGESGDNYGPRERPLSAQSPSQSGTVTTEAPYVASRGVFSNDVIDVTTQMQTSTCTVSFSPYLRQKKTYRFGVF